MNRKLLSLVALFVALIPPTIFVCLDKMPVNAFAALALALMGGVSTYMHSTALEDAATKANTSQPMADVVSDVFPAFAQKVIDALERKHAVPPPDEPKPQGGVQ